MPAKRERPRERRAFIRRRLCRGRLTEALGLGLIVLAGLDDSDMSRSVRLLP